jgi:hypothetical protein
VNQDKSPVDQAIELFVFAPVGLAITAREALPSLIERGRQQVTGQTTMAKMVGQFAVKEGQNRAAKAFDEMRQQAATVFDQFVGDFTDEAPAPNGGNGASASTTAAAPTASPVPPAPPAPVVATPPQSSGTAAADLAITDYDSLAASQVVPRLSGLTADELEQVRLYEAAHRGRKTILSRVAQLQADR